MSAHHLVVGPAENGVVRHALSVAGGAPVLRGAVGDGQALVAALPPGTPVHLAVTDHLLGARTEDAAAWVAAVAAAAPGPVTATLHDLPHAGDGPDRLARRAATYRAVVAVCAGVVVSSEHESALLDALGPVPRPRAVVPLPIDPAAGGARPAARDESRSSLSSVIWFASQPGEWPPEWRLDEVIISPR